MPCLRCASSRLNICARGKILCVRYREVSEFKAHPRFAPPSRLHRRSKSPMVRPGNRRPNAMTSAASRRSSQSMITARCVLSIGALLCGVGPRKHRWPVRQAVRDFFDRVKPGNQRPAFPEGCRSSVGPCVGPLRALAHRHPERKEAMSILTNAAHSSMTMRSHNRRTQYRGLSITFRWRELDRGESWW